MVTEIIFMSIAMTKIIFSSNHLLSTLINLELINLCIISLTWQNNWIMTLWILIMVVMHSIIGFIILLLMIRHFGNDKNLNLIK